MTTTARPADVLAQRSARLDAIAALVRRKTEVELQVRAELVQLWETAAPAERRYVADELAIVLAESARTTQTWVEASLALSAYPELAELVASGVWSIRHADAVLSELVGLDRAQRRAVLDLVLGQAAARTPHELRKATRAAVYVVDPAAAEKAAEKAKTDRSVTVHDERNGAASLLMTGPKAAVAAALAGLDALCGVRPAGDTRTLLQRRFDTLMSLITGEQTAVGGSVLLLVSLATVTGASEQPGVIPGLGHVTAGEARAVVADAAEIRRAVTDGNGELLSLDRTSHRPTPHTPAQEQAAQQDTQDAAAQHQAAQDQAAQDQAAQDQAAQDQAAAAAAGRLLTDVLEPAPLTDAAEAAAADDLAHSVSDEQWLAAELDAEASPEQARVLAAQAWADYCDPCPALPTQPEWQAGQAQLRTILATLQTQETVAGRRVGDAHVLIETDGTLRVHYRNDPTDPDDSDPQGGPEGGPAGGQGPPEGGGGGPPGPPTPPLPAGWVDDRHTLRAEQAGPDPLDDPREVARTQHRQRRRQWLRRQLPSWTASFPAPEPLEPFKSYPGPTLADLDWWSSHPDRALAHAQISQASPLTPTAPTPTGGWPQPAAPAPAWTPEALTRLTGTLRSKPVDPPPADSSSYPFRGALARFIKTRDQTCRFPGCPRLARWCETDHHTPWPLGPTSLRNGVTECDPHHDAKHDLFTLTRLPDGSYRWTLPTGHHADSPPRPLLRGW